MRAVLVAVVALLCAAGCAASEADLRRHAVAFSRAPHPRADVRAPTERELRALRDEDPPRAARDEREAGAWVARALAWLEWLRRGRWLERLQGDYCRPPPSRVAHDDLIGGLAEDPRVPDGCAAATRTLDALRALRDALERSPFPDVLRPLRAAIDELAGSDLECTTTLTGPALAAVRHLVELELYGAAEQCPAIASLGGSVSLEQIRVSEWIEPPPASPPQPLREGQYELFEMPAIRPPFRDGERVEVSFVGLHGASVYLVAVARLAEEWRVIAVLAAGQACG